MRKEIEMYCCHRQYLGVGFIKSRKSESKIMDMAEEMIAAAKRKNLRLLEVIVDESSGTDVDREKIDQLLAWMEKDDVAAIVVKSIFDITKDTEDLRQFMRRAEKQNVSIYEMEHGMNPVYVPWDGGYGC